jgi:hypothetical protein
MTQDTEGYKRDLSDKMARMDAKSLRCVKAGMTLRRNRGKCWSVKR